VATDAEKRNGGSASQPRSPASFIAPMTIKKHKAHRIVRPERPPLNLKPSPLISIVPGACLKNATIKNAATPAKTTYIAFGNGR
jgi:hypothetical protein